jgi:hypothetical protein
LHTLKREGLLLAVFGGFGLLGLPALVFMVGEFLLGEYRPGAGMGSFYADLYGHLGALSPWAWLLVLGPWLAVQMLRLLWLPLRPLVRRRDHRGDEQRDDAPSKKRAERIEPTI